jgi:hypothetical protein
MQGVSNNNSYAPTEVRTNSYVKQQDSKVLCTTELKQQQYKARQQTVKKQGNSKQPMHQNSPGSPERRALDRSPLGAG